MSQTDDVAIRELEREREYAANDQRHYAGASDADLIDEIDSQDYQALPGPLRNYAAWRELRRRLGHPPPPIPLPTD